MIDALEQRPARLLGFVVLAFVLGLAAGNGWATKEALDGEAHWWNQYCHQQVKTHVELQKSIDNN